MRCREVRLAEARLVEPLLACEFLLPLRPADFAAVVRLPDLVAPVAAEPVFVVLDFAVLVLAVLVLAAPVFVVRVLAAPDLAVPVLAVLVLAVPVLAVPVLVLRDLVVAADFAVPLLADEGLLAALFVAALPADAGFALDAAAPDVCAVDDLADALLEAVRRPVPDFAVLLLALLLRDAGLG